MLRTTVLLYAAFAAAFSVPQPQAASLSTCGVGIKHDAHSSVQSVEAVWKVSDAAVSNAIRSDDSHVIDRSIHIDTVDGCPSSLQAGTSVDTVNGVRRARVWWQFYPNQRTYVDDFELLADDTLFARVYARGARQGDILVHNYNNGQQRRIPVSLQGDGSLCFRSASWASGDAPSTTAPCDSAAFTNMKAAQFSSDELDLQDVQFRKAK